jgi:8-oxo-dGTP pyrophosphatase MutT (NUDIX family)
MTEEDRAATATKPSDAATLLVLRQTASPEAGATEAGATEEGVELFCVRRNASSAFLGGVVVFPGGKLDRLDSDRAWRARCNGLHDRAASFADSADHALALAVCACRESLEEAGLLPCQPPISAVTAAAMRAGLSGGGHGGRDCGDPFDEVVAAHGLVVDTVALVPFARWITPAGESRRYDARFFMTTLPPGQEGRHDDHETVSSLWASPARLLEAYRAGDLFLAPPTIRSLTILAQCATIEAALASCGDQSLQPVCPEFVPSDPPMLALPGDPEHSVAERRVPGPTRFVLRDGLFVAEDPG